MDLIEPVKPVKDPIKICHITTVDMTLRFLLMNQLANLQEAGYEVVGISSPGPEIPFIEGAGIRHIAVPMTRRFFTPLADLRTLCSLYRIFRQEKFTIIHTHTPKAGIYGRLAAKFARVPIVIHTHHGFPVREKSIGGLVFRYMEKIAGQLSDLIFSINQEDIEVCTKNGIWPSSKVTLCGQGGIGIDLNRFNPKRISRDCVATKCSEIGLPDGAKVVGFVGRLVREKGLLELLAAARIVHMKIPEIHFLIIGATDNGKGDALTREVAQQYNISNICHFTGLRQDMPELYALMDLFVLPSHREGFGLVLAEAAAMGVPVIATDIKGCREAAENGRNGLLVPVGDVKVLADAIIELLTDREKARRMGEEGRRIAMDRFDERLVFKKVKEEYRRLLREKGLPLPALETISQMR